MKWRGVVAALAAADVLYPPGVCPGGETEPQLALWCYEGGKLSFTLMHVENTSEVYMPTEEDTCVEPSDQVFVADYADHYKLNGELMIPLNALSATTSQLQPCNASVYTAADTEAFKSECRTSDGSKTVVALTQSTILPTSLAAALPTFTLTEPAKLFIKLEGCSPYTKPNPAYILMVRAFNPDNGAHAAQLVAGLAVALFLLF